MTDRPPHRPPDWRRIAKSFVYAGRGIVLLLQTQSNAQVHAAVACVTILAGWWFGINRGEWCAVVAAIGLVWTAEGLNSALEAVVDLVSPEHHPLAGRAKDLAAGAVLLAAVCAAIIGLLVFGPRVWALVGL